MSEDLKKVRDSALRVSGNPAFQAMEIANVSKKKKKANTNSRNWPPKR